MIIYNEMNYITQVKPKSKEDDFYPYSRNEYPSRLPYTQNYRVNAVSIRGERSTLIAEQQEQRQTLQLKAKKHLFQQSEVHNHNEATKSYERGKNTKKSKSMMLQSEEEITAFQYQDKPRKQSPHLERLKNTKSNQLHPTKKRHLRFQIPNHQIYWNKKQNAQVMILRPTILNPSMLQNEHIDALKNTIESEPNKKDFQRIINKIVSSSKQSNTLPISYNAQRFKKRARIRSIEKKMVHFRSKSTNFIEEYQRTQLLNEIEKATENCAFDLQIKCLHSQKQLIQANKTNTVKSNKDLRQRIKHLLTKQSKGNHHNTQSKQKANESIQDLSVKNECKAQKLQVIQSRSKSCIAGTWKGGENKKVKIGHILSKFAKFKTEQLQNKRRMMLERQGEDLNKSVELLKINLKLHQNRQKQRENVLKYNQDHIDSSAKKALINSIKLYCHQKSTQQLPIVSTLLS